MKSIHAFMCAAALAAGVSGPAFGQAADVGLVNLLSGEVTYQGDGSAAKAKAYMKVRQGDRFNVPAGAQVRIVYFQGGRQETWKGPSAFRTGSQASEPSSGKPAEVATLPSAVPQQISQIPELIQIAKLGRSGGVQVRGAGAPPRVIADQQADVAKAKDTYRSMRTQASADDITPELYLYSVLQDYLMYEDMKPVVDEMMKRQPENPDVQALAEYARTRADYIEKIRAR
jgi:hypothetical protein